MKDNGQSGRIRTEYGNGDRGNGYGPGDTKKLGASSGHTLNQGPGTIRNAGHAPTPDHAGSVNKASTGKLSI